MARRSSARKKAAKEKKRRLNKAHNVLEKYFDFDTVFNFETLFEAAKKCKRGVIWKNSVIGFDKMRAVNCAKLADDLNAGTYKLSKSKHFSLCERGKLRHISAVSFRDRVVQRAFCDHSLLPVLSYSLIYDNAASLPGKGTSFARRRFEERLLAACRKWENPHIALVDFSNFFGSIDSTRAFEMLKERYIELAQTDKEYKSVMRLMSVAKIFVCDEACLGLGNQTSQLVAIWYLNSLDHMSGQFGHYGRYMDDAYCICETKNLADEFLARYRDISSSLGLVINERKTHVLSIKKSKVTFLKRVYIFDANKCAGAGGLDIYMSACALRASRHHLKGVVSLHRKGVLTDDDLAQVLASLKSNVASTSHPAGLYNKFIRESKVS